jgi:hypothetical protein
MADGQHKLSRRALLGAVCAAPALSAVVPAQAGTPARPAPSPSPWDPGLRRDDEPSSAVTIWDRAVARFRAAQAALDAAAHEPDQDAYDALLDAHSAALTTLLALPAPDPAALAAKLDHIIAEQAWELTGSEDCLEILREDTHRLAATRPEWSHPKHQRG